MKKITFLFVLLTAISVSAFAQSSDEKDALAVVNTMFTEMANHNPPAISALWTKEAMLTAIVRGKEGKSRIVSLTSEAFSKNFSEKKNEIRELMYAPETKVDGDLALVSGRYVFFVDGKISHCGINAFHVVRTESGWKIAGASSTIDPTNCTTEEKAMTAPK